MIHQCKIPADSAKGLSSKKESRDERYRDQDQESLPSRKKMSRFLQNLSRNLNTPHTASRKTRRSNLDSPLLRSTKNNRHFGDLEAFAESSASFPPENMYPLENGVSALTASSASRRQQLNPLVASVNGIPVTI